MLSEAVYFPDRGGTWTYTMVLSIFQGAWTNLMSVHVLHNVRALTICTVRYIPFRPKAAPMAVD